MWKLQMEKNKTLSSRFLRKHHYNVTIEPNIDNAFIVALIVIVHAIPSILGRALLIKKLIPFKEYLVPSTN
jgi:hypothetical protein